MVLNLILILDSHGPRLFLKIGMAFELVEHNRSISVLDWGRLAICMAFFQL